MTKIRTFYVIFLTTVCASLHAQRHEIFDEQIRTLQVVANNDWLSMPVLKLNEGFLDIDFDDFTHEYRRFTYKIEHCEADWSVSESLFESEYIAGLASGNTIDDVRESLLTDFLYTHYHLQIPNSNCYLKLSGNYKLTVYDDNDNEKPVLTACFMVVEPKMGVGLKATSNTVVDVNSAHQQIAMEVSYNSLHVVDYQSQIKTVVLQNGRWDDARWNAIPQYITPDGLGWSWDFGKALLFNGGNEYHKFETLSTDHPSMGIDQLAWDGQQYHAYVYADAPRLNYVYDEDANGAFYIRNSDNINNDYQSEYLWVHFQMMSPERLSNGSVYLNGNWTYDCFLPQYQMVYDEEKHIYQGEVLLKQGYYSYQYLQLDKDGNTHIIPTEGNFFQTENQYQALIYYREQGGRTDKLVGYQQISFPKRHP